MPTNGKVFHLVKPKISAALEIALGAVKL